jgi:hypothetical protein
VDVVRRYSVIKDEDLWTVVYQDGTPTYRSKEAALKAAVARAEAELVGAEPSAQAKVILIEDETEHQHWTSETKS